MVCQGQNSGIVTILINIAPDVPRDYLQHANEANEGDVEGRRRAAKATVAPFGEPCWAGALSQDMAECPAEAAVASEQ